MQFLDYKRKDNELEFVFSEGLSLSCGKYCIGDEKGTRWPGNLSADSDVKHELHINRISGNAVEFRQSLNNQGSETQGITEINMFDGIVELKNSGWKVAHVELFKKDIFFEDYNCFTGNLLEPIPGVAGEFGLSEDLPFPGLFFTHPERGTILMSVLTQNRCKPVWTLHSKGQHVLLKAWEFFSGVPDIQVSSGDQFDTERWLLLYSRGGIEDAVDDYYSILSERIDFHGNDSILRNAIVWGSWNYNYRPRGHMDIDHDYIVGNAHSLAERIPHRPTFVMIDDGYQTGSSELSCGPGWFASFMEIFHDDTEPPHDPKLFPHGMGEAADSIRKAGTSPAIWATPRLHSDSALAKARPELLLSCSEGRQFGRRGAYLDYSLPEVRSYIRAAWDTVFNEWGYKAIKLDFWTLPFEIPYVCYQNKDYTAIELRNMFLKDLREFIPQDGYILTGVAVNGGNPFVGRYVDAVRTGTDIGDGDWQLIVNSSSYLTGVSPFFNHDCVLSDPDSLGYCPENEENINRLWATMVLMTGGMCEIGGDLRNLSGKADDLVGKAVEFFAPAKRTYVEVDQGGINNTPAPRIVLEREDGVYEACLNWTAMPREFRLPEQVRDIWTGKRMNGCHRIPPKTGVLFKR